MTRRFDIRPPRDDAEESSLLDVLAATFNFPREDADKFARRVGAGNFRVVLDGSRLLGGLALIPMGQHFGGVSVPMTGIAAVGIDPTARGGGAATALMRETMRELHDDGRALSTLYPATQTLYRAADFEQAGGHYLIKLDLARLSAAGGRGLDVREAGDDDEALLRTLYTEDARRHDGTLDRGSYVWSRVRKPRGETTRTFIVDRDGTVEGYVVLRYAKSSGDAAYELRITDLVALSADAGRRLLAFLADHRSLAERAVLYRSPADPLLALLPEQHYGIELDMHWMMRVTHVEAALTARGYAPSVSGTVHLRVRDEVVPGNGGDYALHVDGGRATVERGGEGRIEIDARGLAMLYSGHRSPAGVAAAGLLRGPAEDLAIAAGVFAGGPPWMADKF